ncbi:RidA family protein [Pararhodobacter sp.]|uniref:RidA family protein n=1 Tax=Pararhodobacter sp. TaxID=2127056 RepID=UPI002AFE583E|nr:RidA family protein [Pararhodobacter sp.]
MPHALETRLAELGLSLPDAPAPAANYVPWVISGNQVFVSGQISQSKGGLITGKLGADLSTEQGAEAARNCALSLLAQLRAAVDGDLSRLKRVVKLVGFVNCTPDFTDQPKVINGASDLMVELLGDVGRHARSAVGTPSLPLGVAVEIEAIFEIS